MQQCLVAVLMLGCRAAQAACHLLSSRPLTSLCKHYSTSAHNRALPCADSHALPTMPLDVWPPAPAIIPASSTIPLHPNSKPMQAAEANNKAEQRGEEQAGPSGPPREHRRGPPGPEGEASRSSVGNMLGAMAALHQNDKCAGLGFRAFLSCSRVAV